MKIPTITDLVTEDDSSLKQNALMVILNQEPPKAWISQHPIVKIKKDGKMIPLPYLPIERVEYLLTRVYRKWWVDVKNVSTIANSVVVTVRLFVTNPITENVEWNDGVGAAPIITDKDAGASDWNKVKSAGVQMAAPSAESFAIKDAAEKFGKLFGKDLTRRENIIYDNLLREEITIEELRDLLDFKKNTITAEDREYAQRIINNQEGKSYKKLKDFLNNPKTKTP